MTKEFEHLTRNETCIARLYVALDEMRPSPLGDRYTFARGFVEGWRERGIAEPGMVTITREHYADLERRAATGGMT